MTEVLTQEQANLIKVLDAIQENLHGEAWSLAMDARPHVYEGNLVIAREFAIKALATDLTAVKEMVVVARNEWSWLNSQKNRVGLDRPEAAYQHYATLRDSYFEAKKVAA